MTIGDDDDDKFEYGTNTKIIVTIVIIVTAGFGRGAGSPFQRAALPGESTAVDRGSAPLGMYLNTAVGRYIPRNSLGEPTTPLQRS